MKEALKRASFLRTATIIYPINKTKCYVVIPGVSLSLF